MIDLILLNIRCTSSEECYADIHGICQILGWIAMIQLISKKEVPVRNVTCIALDSCAKQMLRRDTKQNLLEWNLWSIGA